MSSQEKVHNYTHTMTKYKCAMHVESYMYHCRVVWCRALIAGGGAPEIEVALRLMEDAQSLSGLEAYCVRGFADAMEVIPFTLAENAGLHPIAVVTELRKRHANGEKTAGINVRKVCTHWSCE